MKRWWCLLLAASSRGCASYQARYVTERPPPPAVWEDVTPDAGR
ncbi:MAG: hypothetical protein AB1730_16050 [Myxococcota bacterium]|jgi:hypothetical protein